MKSIKKILVGIAFSPNLKPNIFEAIRLANMFGAVPVMVQGSTGFKVNNLSTEMQQLADIQEGDIIAQVDGVPISEIMANPAMWLKFSSSTSLPLSVMRDNQMQIIYINASSLSAKMMPSLGL